VLSNWWLDVKNGIQPVKNLWNYPAKIYICESGLAQCTPEVTLQKEGQLHKN